MKKHRKPLQREIWRVDLGQPVGRELASLHACVVLQTDMLNRRLETVVIAPLVKNGPWRSDEDPAFAVMIPPTARNGLDRRRWVDITQLRCVSLERLHSRQGELEEDYFWNMTPLSGPK